MVAKSLTRAAESVAWARVWPAVKRSLSRILRRGAWYPVMDDAEPNRVCLRISDRTVPVPRSILEVVPRQPRPRRFTVVYATAGDPSPASGVTTGRGTAYAVCPRCAARFGLFPNQPTSICRDCGHHGDIAWWETG